MTDLRDSISPFGVLDFLAWDHDWNAYHYAGDKVDRTAALMEEAGVGFVRMDFLWSDIEPEKGKWEFAKYDRLVKTLWKHHIKVAGLLAYNPLWSGSRWNHAPDHTLYARYARRVVEHFNDRVRHWEIWNEPDHENYWRPQDEMASYVQLLRRVYPLLKEADPTCVVHIGGMSRCLPASMKQIYTHGGQDFFDVTNIHPFSNPTMPDVMEGLWLLFQSVRKVMDAHGDQRKPIWFSEVGCPGMADPQSTVDWWLGRNTNEAQQAEWVRKLYAEPLRWTGVEKIFWTYFRDVHRRWGDGTDYFGLVRENFSKKPAFEAYQQAVKLSSN